METTDFSNYTTMRLLELIEQLTPEQIEENACQLSVGQVSDLLPALFKQDRAYSEEKVFAIISGMVERRQLEAAGKVLAPSQALAILEQYQDIDHPQHWKLSPIFIGMPFSLFSQILSMATDNQLQLLKQEAITEPIQHHLSLLCNEMTVYLTLLMELMHNFQKDLERLKAESLGFSDLEWLKLKIEQMADDCWLSIEKLDRALSLAWNTDRSDLIEKLSMVKEQCQRALVANIGHARSQAEAATGLYLMLEMQLNAVYGNANDPKDIEALHDEDPAIDALVKFSVWYLQDYVELGLLSEVKSKAKLNMDPQRYRELARQRLHMMGLATVRDLKRAGIFSRATLAEYIKKQPPNLKRTR